MLRAHEKTTLYVTEPGTVIGRAGESLLIRHGKETVLEIPARRVNGIVILGNAAMTTQAVDLVLEHGVSVAYLSSAGRFKARLEPGMNGNGNLRRRQSLTFSSEPNRISLAITVIQAKLHNCVAVMHRKKGFLTKSPVKKMKRFHKEISAARTMPEIMGCEGAIAKTYFDIFRKALTRPMGFQRRAAHPPSDPVNALLSLGYSLLHNHTCSAILQAGLDPYIGFIHADRSGHPTLASDLMEPFRPIVSDSVVLSLINREMITKKDFRHKKEGPRLTGPAVQRFFTAFDQRMATRVTYPGSKEPVSYIRCLEYQARDLARHLTGETEFQAFMVRG